MFLRPSNNVTVFFGRLARNKRVGENNQNPIQGWIIPRLACIYNSYIHPYREQKVLGIIELRLEEIRKPWYHYDNMISQGPFYLFSL